MFINLTKTNKKIFDFYTPEYFLGRGTYGEVYKVSENKTKKLQAIKILKKQGVN